MGGIWMTASVSTRHWEHTQQLFHVSVALPCAPGLWCLFFCPGSLWYARRASASAFGESVLHSDVNVNQTSYRCAQRVYVLVVVEMYAGVRQWNENQLQCTWIARAPG